MPLLWALLGAAAAGVDRAAWAALMQEPQLPKAWLLTMGTGVAATVLSLALSAWVIGGSFPGPAWQRLVRWLPPLLATPHAAFAIGLAFLVAPSGWVLRALSPWATGLDAPPPWPTTQDPWGLGLVAVLVAKEVPFLLWTAAAQLQRADAGGRLARELTLARTLGYSPRRAWRVVGWPQLAPRL
ncbi:MAG: ABC transporter permease, partial [Comamonadaceae bacterium]